VKRIDTKSLKLPTEKVSRTGKPKAFRKLNEATKISVVGKELERREREQQHALQAMETARIGNLSSRLQITLRVGGYLLSLRFPGE